MAQDFVTSQEIIVAARAKLDQHAWNYLSGGAESETTMRRNRLGLDCLAFRPRILVDVTNVDPSTTFLGQKLRIPAILAPIGSLQILTPEGALAVARAAEEFGTVNFVSSVTEPSLEETAAASRTCIATWPGNWRTDTRRRVFTCTTVTRSMQKRRATLTNGLSRKGTRASGTPVARIRP